MARRVVLLTDEPADVDRFGGAHSRIAETLADLIHTGNGGWTVALEGMWGSGKSTVVNLLTKKLASAKDDDHLVFVFDAWAHQGDPLRRSFLETALEELIEKGWIRQKYWQGRKAELAGRKTVTEVTTTPRLTLAGKLLTIPAALTPVGLVLLNAVLGGSIEIWPLVGALSVTLGVLLVAAVLFVSKCFVKSPEAKKNLDPLAPLVSSHVRDETSSTFDSGEPTSIEFENFFREMVKEALDVPARRLVIVLDNLDRVDHEQARSILATLQTFRPSQGDPWSNQLWTIVPFDPGGLHSLWEQPTAPTAFLEKLFDVTLHVPPLIVSDWQSFLNEQMQLALPDVSDQDRREIAEVYAAWMLDTQGNRSATRTRTPRALKQFINEVGTVSCTNNDVSYTAAAAFVLLRRSDSDIVVKLLEKNGVSPRVGSLLGADWPVQLAAAHFGTSKDGAQQLLLDAPIRDALRDGDSTRLSELSAVVGFYEVLPHCPIESWSERGAVDLAGAAATFWESGVAEQERAAPMIDAMLRGALSADQWLIESPRSGTGFARLSMVALERSRAGIDAINKRVFVGDGVDPNLANSSLDERYSGLEAFAVHLVEPLAGATTPIMHTGTNNDFVALCGRLGHNPATRAIWRLFRSTEDPDSVARAVGAFVTAPPDGWSVGELFDVLLTESSRVDGEAVATSFGVWFEGDVSDQDLTRAALDVLDRLSRLDGNPADSVLEQCRAQGQLLHAAYVASTHGAHDNVAAALLLHVMGRPALPAPPNDRSNQAGYELADAVFTSPESHLEVIACHARRVAEPDLPIPHAILDGNPNFAPWVKAVLAQIVINEPELPVSAADLMLHWDHYRALLDSVPLERTVGKLVVDDGLLDRLCVEPRPSHWGEIADAVTRWIEQAESSEHATNAASRLVDWLTPLLERLGQEEWQEALSEPDLPMCRLVVWLTKTSVGPELGLSLEMALTQHAEAVASGEGVVALEADDWETLLARLTRQESRTSLAHDLVGMVVAKGGVVSARFWDLYGRLLADDDASRRDERIALEIVQPMIEARDPGGLAWVIETATTHPDLLEVGEERRDRLRQLVDTAMGDVPDSPSTDTLRRLRDLLG